MKMDQITKNIKDKSAVILENPINIRYLTKKKIDEGFLLLTKENNYLFIDDRYWLDVKEMENIKKVKLTNFATQINKLLKDMDIKTIFLESQYVTLSKYKRYKEIFLDKEINNSDIIDKILEKMRKNKTEEEIKKIKEGQKITDQVFKNILQYIKEGTSEKAIAKKIEDDMISLGGEGKAFDTIVVSGSKTAIPHGKPTDKEIKYGDLVTMDFGVIFDGYCTDMTRTVAVGKIESQGREIYEIVLGAQKEAIKSIKKGLKGKEIDKVGREYINKFGYGKYFTHSLGHGVGLEIHEKPMISNKSEDIIETGNIITIEPGIYVPGKLGVRIEDMILIKDNEIENLTHSDKELIII